MDDIIIMLEKEKERLLKLFYNLITDSSTFFLRYENFNTNT